MDKTKLINLIFEKTGQKIGEDDPILSTLALNQAVLEDYVDRVTREVDAASSRIEVNAGALLAGSRAVLAETGKIVAEADKLHQAAAAKAAETAKTTLADEAARLVTDAARSAVQTVLEDAARQLANATNAYAQACLSVRAEADAVKKAAKMDLVAVAGAGILVAIVGGVIGGYVGRWQVDSAIVVDPETAQLGRDMKNMFKHLDRDTADKVMRALDRLHGR
jgi:L-lactate utilization protein LutC